MAAWASLVATGVEVAESTEKPGVEEAHVCEPARMS